MVEQTKHGTKIFLPTCSEQDKKNSGHHNTVKKCQQQTNKNNGKKIHKRNKNKSKRLHSLRMNV